MARKKAGVAEAPAAAPPTRKIRSVPGSIPWNEWADEFTEAERVDFPKLVDRALEHYARHRKFRKPPRR